MEEPEATAKDVTIRLKCDDIVTNPRKGGGYKTGSGKDDECPHLCDFTVTLCGMCVPDNVPEDINFAFVGRTFASEWYLRMAAGYVHYRGTIKGNSVVTAILSGISAGVNITLSAGTYGGDVTGEKGFKIGFTLKDSDLKSEEAFCKVVKKHNLTQRPCRLCKTAFPGWGK